MGDSTPVDREAVPRLEVETAPTLPRLEARRARAGRYVQLGPEVAEALTAGRAVVALESTIIAHGMPHPRNVETALQVEAEVRAHGAVPATVAVLDGSIRVGITADEIARLAHPESDVMKLSRRDLAFALHDGRAGATTVAATMIAADLAGIEVFATGGIGGVHRGAAETFDVSADLQELAATPITVVCAGVKSILDIAATLEYLETHGVPVIGFGTDSFPAFFTPDSGISLDHRLDSPAEIAEIVRIRADLGLRGGMVVANPIATEHAMEPSAVDAAIAQALTEAQEGGVAGPRTTPFLLDRVAELTGSGSLESNVALVTGNARVAAQIAVALADRP